ncbi:MAG TPA: TIR domain-containing protein [Acetobacteraceae bacterium]|jgi:hypothetical protein
MKGFISYAHADFDECREFHKLLMPVARHCGVEFWWDPKLQTGAAWNQAIADAIAAAEVFVAFVSAESLYSTYISGTELPAMRMRAQGNGGLILPILLNRCLWQFDFAAAQLAPTFKAVLKPIVDWHPRHHGYHAAAEQAADAMQRYYNLQPAHHAATVP